MHNKQTITLTVSITVECSNTTSRPDPDDFGEQLAAQVVSALPKTFWIENPAGRIEPWLNAKSLTTVTSLHKVNA